MKIEISVQEYFNELKLMEKQYGQEEDLYPWIYMLLQMAECKKKEILKDLYEEVSIRDVHNWKKKPSEKMERSIKKTILEKISSIQGGPPEFLILSGKQETNSENICCGGCVEIKKFNEKEWMTLLPGIYKNGKITWNGKKIVYKFSTREKFEEDNFIKIIKKDLQGNDIEYQDIKYKGKKQYTFIFQAEIYGKCNEIEYKTKKLCEQDRKCQDRKIEEETYTCYEHNQIVGFLNNFNCVLYTNGLEFYLLTKGEEDNIKVESLANLANLYENYKSEGANASTLLEAVAEWDKLIAGLTKINWYAEPTTLISEDSK